MNRVRLTEALHRATVEPRIFAIAGGIVGKDARVLHRQHPSEVLNAGEHEILLSEVMRPHASLMIG